MHRLRRTTSSTSRARRRRAGLVLAAVLPALGAAAALAGASPTPSLARVNSYGASPIPSFGMVRTANGTLHLLYQTTPVGGGTPSGLTSRTISASGAPGAATTALSGWKVSRPGLTALPNGSLVAVFGAQSPQQQVADIWAISSSDGGATWSAPAAVGSGTDENLAYASDMTLQQTGGTPVLTAPQAGGVVVQQGLGQGSPTQLVTDSSDNFAGMVNTAFDASTHEVVASWSSNAGSGGEYVRAVAPTLGAVQKLSGQHRNGVVIAGRDAGPGVFGAYTPDGHAVRVFRYGGGSVAVGKVSTVTPEALAVATSLDGRIWVMWGDEAGNPGLVVTRSNMAVTRFEPLQRITMHVSQLQRIGGDGRLGPLDLLVDMRPAGGSGAAAAPGLFHARILPVLAAAVSVKAVKNKKGVVTKHVVTVKVTDAGDAVPGATVAVAGAKAKTGASGVASLTLPAAVAGVKPVSVTAPTYRPLTVNVNV